MATSETAICNSALVKIGGKRITSLDDISPLAQTMKEQYDKHREELLYSHPWKFAMKSYAPAEIAKPPGVNTPDFRFGLPLDCLRVVGTDGKTDRWYVQDGSVYVDRTFPVIYYIANITDVSKFTPGFSEVLACKIAADICYQVTQSVSLTDKMTQQYEAKLRQVRSYSAQEGSVPRVYADDWLHSRY